MSENSPLPPSFAFHLQSSALLSHVLYIKFLFICTYICLCMYFKVFLHKGRI